MLDAWQMRATIGMLSMTGTSNADGTNFSGRIKRSVQVDVTWIGLPAIVIFYSSQSVVQSCSSHETILVMQTHNQAT